MTKLATALAFDLGASSGRAIIGQLDPGAGRLTIKEIHRFPNDPVKAGDRLYWDILRLLHEIKQGILKAKNFGCNGVESLGIDSWAVDFGLLGQSGELLGNPYHYRDRHTEGELEKVVKQIGRDTIFSRTGLQFLPFNTIYQLSALKSRNPDLLEQAETLLMIPDLLIYFLTGEKKSEYTNATTTQLLNPSTKDWDRVLLSELGLPDRILLPPVPSGTRVGALSPSVCDELGVEPVPVIAVAEHDTASAVAAVPSLQKDFAYLICGTWSLLGTELESPILGEQVLEWNFTNEGGVYGTNRLLKNIMGLWLIQECKRCWEKEGDQISFAELAQLAQQAEPFQSFIDPDDTMFLNPNHMPKQIQLYCKETNQFMPQTKGEIARCIFESLALKYRMILDRTEILSGKTFSGLHIVGGGIQNEFLCQLTAGAIGREVWAGPTEASALGNLVVQYISLGHIADLSEARRIIGNSFPVKTYLPTIPDQWRGAYEIFGGIVIDASMK